MFKKHRGNGFTLIEIIIVLTIISITSAILVGYSRESARQLLLINYQAKLVSLITRAKSLSTTTFLEGPPPSPGDPKTCGYGLHVDQALGEAFVFRDLAVNCALSDNRFSSGDVKLESQLNTFKLDTKLYQFAADTTLTDVIFIPPDPVIIINGSVPILEGVLSVEPKDQTNKSIIRINNVGRISTQ